MSLDPPLFHLLSHLGHDVPTYFLCRSVCCLDPTATAPGMFFPPGPWLPVPHGIVKWDLQGTMGVVFFLSPLPFLSPVFMAEYKITLVI